MLLSRVQRVYDGNGDLVYENKILKKSYGDIYIFPSDKRLAKYTKDEEEMEHLRQML